MRTTALLIQPLAAAYIRGVAPPCISSIDGLGMHSDQVLDQARVMHAQMQSGLIKEVALENCIEVLRVANLAMQVSYIGTEQ